MCWLGSTQWRESEACFKERVLIVGLDPGLITGIAALDLDGNVLSLSSERELGEGELIQKLLELGKPLIIACDVSPTPKLVEKLCMSLGCKHWSPKKLGVEEKNKLVGPLLKLVADKHQRDALAAACMAYRSHSPVLHRLRRVLKAKGLEYLYERAASKLLREEARSVSEAIHSCLTHELEAKLEELKHRYTELQRLLARREEELRRLRKLLDRLKR